MKIGLVRHFPVEKGMPKGWMTSGQLIAWRQDYEKAGVNPVPVELGPTRWIRCVASDLPRAFVTARAIFPGEVFATAQLREAQFAEFGTGGLRLPVWCWGMLLKWAWYRGHRSQRACRDEFVVRVRAMADTLTAAAEDTLVVSHGGVMMFLSAELKARGFVGPKLRMPNHAQLYLYERA